MYNYNYSEDHLMHYGVKGMKWGHRRVRGHGGPGKYLTKKRQLAGDKRDLETLNKGGHLSVGLTKKRQAALDKRDKAVLEKRIAENEKALGEQYTKALSKTEKVTKGLKVAEKILNSTSGPNGPKIHIDPTNMPMPESALERERRKNKERDDRMGRPPTRKEEDERQRKYNI